MQALRRATTVLSRFSRVQIPPSATTHVPYARFSAMTAPQQAQSIGRRTAFLNDTTMQAGGQPTYSLIGRASGGLEMRGGMLTFVRTAIRLMSRLTVIDNSGAKEIMCIGHVRNKSPGKIGDSIRAVVKSAKPGGKVSKKDIVAAVIVRARSWKSRPDGTTLKFQENAAVLLKRDLSGPIGTKVTGPVARELRYQKQMKIVMMSSRTV
mmetsp:Transcript_48398/g.104884  ORF Transcript_48398/g.104884 Transcript_48398/m.104884 type:complete len:208 (+) Transcript_48398:135-758(+)